MSKFLVSLAHILSIAINAVHMRKELTDYISCRYMPRAAGGILLVSYTLILTSLWCLLLNPPDGHIVSGMVNLITFVTFCIGRCSNQSTSEVQDNFDTCVSPTFSPRMPR